MQLSATFRKTMLVGLTVISAFFFIQFSAPNLEVLIVGQILLGVPLGLFQTNTVMYALEIAPLCLRPYLINYVNTCWSLGKIIGAGMLRGACLTLSSPELSLASVQLTLVSG